MNLAWAGPMLAEAGGWRGYNNTTADFAYNAGVLNSYLESGLVERPVRYAVKLAMALLWTLGPALSLRSPRHRPARPGPGRRVPRR